MATVAGGVLAAYIGFLGGDDPALRLQFAKHLLAASVMAAPGAIVISKILYPQQEAVNTDVEVSSEKIGSNNWKMCDTCFVTYCSSCHTNSSFICNCLSLFFIWPSILIFHFLHLFAFIRSANLADSLQRATLRRGGSSV